MEAVRHRRAIALCLVLALSVGVSVHGDDDRDESSINPPLEKTCQPVTPPQPVLPTEVGSSILDLRWIVPRDSNGKITAEVDKVVLALSEGQDGRYGGHLYRSENYGASGSWHRVSEELMKALSPEEIASISPDERELGIVDMHFLAEQAHHILLEGSSNLHWTTRDYGRTFKKVNLPTLLLGSGVSFKLHPANPNLIIAHVRSPKSMPDEPILDLLVSEDFGFSWRSMLDLADGRIKSFVDYEWGAALHPDPKYAGYQEKTIFATIYDAGEDTQRGWDSQIDFVRSEDFFDTNHEMYMRCGNYFEIISGKIFLAIPSDCPWDSTGKAKSTSAIGSGENAVIYVSEDFGRTFAESCVPVKHIGDNGYELRETHDKHGVYVLIDHDEEEEIEAAAPVFNLYSSGAVNATLFSLSLERVYSVDYFNQKLADWHRVESMPGVYIANQLDVGAMTAKTMQQREWSSFVESMITFNGGGHWQHLQAPKKFRNPECNLCAGQSDCRLHLHGASSWVGGVDGRPSVYSHVSAPGIVMASGNTGNHLEFNQDFQCTWMSRDGGFTWEDVAHGMFIYEYGDHGGLILMARHRNQGAPTDVLYYSHDGGECWEKVRLAEALFLENIRVEPLGASHTFVLHGEQCERQEKWTSQGFNCTFEVGVNTRPKGVMYTIDFKEIRGDWSTCGKGDFEPWSPPVPELCLLGRNITYERRKDDAKCFNSKAYMRPIKVDQCACGEEDVECDYGFFRSSYKAKCEKIEQIADSRSCPALEEGYKISSTSLRYVHGDTCSDPLGFIPDAQPPPTFEDIIAKVYGKTSSSSGFGTVLLIIVLVGGALPGIVFVWLKMFASDDTKEAASEACSPILGACVSCVGLLGDVCCGLVQKISGRSENRPTDAFFRPLPEDDGLAFDAAGTPLVGPGYQTMA